MSSKSLVVQIQSLSEDLTKIVLKSSDVQNNSSQCIDLLKSLEEITIGTANGRSQTTKKPKINISILDETKIGVCLNKMLKTFRRLNRSNDNTDNNDWKECIDLSQRMLATWKDIVKKQREEINTETSAATSSRNKLKADNNVDKNSTVRDLPTSITVYRSRLISQKKEIYKDPPVLPPPSIIIESDFCPLPKRNSSTGECSFVLSPTQLSLSSSESKLQQYIKDFKPNRTPEEVLRAGSFGGTYFRPIVSSVTNIKYNPKDVLKETVDPKWISNLDHKTMLTSPIYKQTVNKYKVKCGGSLGMWESSGWIADSDPYGWFQWYCNFYRGRRCDDDERQISRWLKSAGPKGRFRSQLCNKIFAQGGMKQVNDVSISPVIRQTLLHWGLEITEDVLRKHGKRVGKL